MDIELFKAHAREILVKGTEFVDLLETTTAIFESHQDEVDKFRELGQLDDLDDEFDALFDRLEPYC